MTFDNHFDHLAKAYSEVGTRTWLSDDFLESNLESSRSLFTPESMASRHPRPKELEVFALLSGLPFTPDFVNQLVGSQQRISEVLGTILHYWVAPANFGLEYCVFKWPTESLSEEQLRTIQGVLGSIHQQSYRFNISGIQINPDGCVVAKGYDENGVIFKVREQLKKELPFLPAKQSGWAHVPMGRILEPLGPEKFKKLSRLAESMSALPAFTTEITSMKLVHETRWYMEEKAVLSEYSLTSGCR